MSIQRYDYILGDRYPSFILGMDDGRYVLYSDHLTDKQADLDAQQAAQAAEVERLRGERDNNRLAGIRATKRAYKAMMWWRSRCRSYNERQDALRRACVGHLEQAERATKAEAERNAAVARAERAEAIIYDEVMDHRAHGFCDCPLCKFADAALAGKEPNNETD